MTPDKDLIAMTDQQREAAARELCRLRGVDPDTRICHGPDPMPGRNSVPLVVVYSPAWKRALREIEAHERMQAAIAFGLRS